MVCVCVCVIWLASMLSSCSMGFCFKPWATGLSPIPAARSLLCLLSYKVTTGGETNGKGATPWTETKHQTAAGRISILPRLLSSPSLHLLCREGGKKNRRRRKKEEVSLALRREEVKRGEERRRDFNIETCPPADSGSFCEAVGGEGWGGGGGGGSALDWQANEAAEPMGAGLKNKK